jgi:hypothetical protein
VSGGGKGQSASLTRRSERRDVLCLLISTGSVVSDIYDFCDGGQFIMDNSGKG